MAAFCMLSALAFSFKERKWQVIALILAVLAGASRIYLGQHYLVDVLAGSGIGVLLSTLIFHGLGDSWKSARYQQKLFRSS